MLSKDILENIKTLLAVTASIKETYDKLKELEINGQKESQEFKGLIEALKSSLALEKSIYDRFPDDIDILNKIEYTVCDKNDYWINFNLQDSIESIIKNHNLINIRIRLNLFNKMLTIKNALFDIDVNDKEVLKNYSPKKILIINATVVRDFINTILTILNLYLNNPQYQVIYDLLLNFKYGLSFLYKEIEEDFLENNFNINGELYWLSNAVADLYKFNREKLNSIKRGSAQYVFNKNINDIIEIFLDAESSKEEIFAYTLSEVLVRASLLLSGDETVTYFKEQKLRLAPNSSNNKRAQEILKQAQAKVDRVYNMYDKDKELLNIISLRMI